MMKNFFAGSFVAISYYYGSIVTAELVSQNVSEGGAFLTSGDDDTFDSNGFVCSNTTYLWLWQNVTGQRFAAPQSGLMIPTDLPDNNRTADQMKMCEDELNTLNEFGLSDKRVNGNDNPLIDIFTPILFDYNLENQTNFYRGYLFIYNPDNAYAMCYFIPKLPKFDDDDNDHDHFEKYSFGNNNETHDDDVTTKASYFIGSQMHYPTRYCELSIN
jgi:hypothetical protein